MPTDWEWAWAGQGGRDAILRDSVEGLYADARAARQQTARLSSRLAQVQGSLETRLSALAAAFDAYVELGDLREQLAGYPDTSAVRRAATRALEVLARGGVPERLRGETPDYWLVDGTNAVIALAEGTPDAQAEARAVALDRDAELFIVAAAGALGHGPRVGARVPPLLVTDGELSAAQLALWRAVLAGAYGDVLPAVRGSWQPALEASDAAWQDWVSTEARASTPLEILRWLERVLARPEADAARRTEAAADVRLALTAVALTLVDRGLGEEVALLERARELRARIERPGEQSPPRRQAPPAAGERPTTALEEVRAAFLAAAPGSSTRTELLRWVRPGLLATVDRCQAAVDATGPAPVPVSTPAGSLAVAHTGVTAEQRAQAEERLRQRYAVPPGAGVRVPAVAGIVLVLAVLVAGGFGNAGLVVLFGIGAVVAAVLVLRGVVEQRRRRQNLEADLQTLARLLTTTEERAGTLESDRLDEVAEVRRLAAAVRERVTAVPG